MKDEKAEKADKANKGQAKEHLATRTQPDGTVEERLFTQAEWKQRDKSAGWQRPDDTDDAQNAVE